MINLFKKENKYPEQKFWNWFLNNKTGLEEFIRSDFTDYSLYNQLTKEIKKYNSLLFPEITISNNEEFVLIITPDGISKGVLATKKLFNEKPKINDWVVKKFRQPTDKISLNYKGIEYPSSDIEILPEIDNKRHRVNIQAFIRNMNSDIKRYQSLAWLYLDHILGEFNTITKIGYVKFFHLEKDKSLKNGISVIELRKHIETEL